MDDGINQNFTDGVGRNFVNILTVKPFDSCAKLDIAKNELIGLFLLLLYRPFIFAFVYEVAFHRSFEDSALRHGWKKIMTGQ